MIHFKLEDVHIHLNPKQVSSIENILNADNTWNVKIVMNNGDLYQTSMDNNEFIDLIHKCTFQ